MNQQGLSNTEVGSVTIETDDSERMMRKFDKVFTLFCNPEVSIEDDTIPDRLLSCICEMLTLMSQKNGAVSLQEFLRLEGVDNLMTNAPLCHRNTKIAAFTLKVYALLGKIEGGYQLIAENGSLKKAFAGCRRSDMFLDATVREAWFTALEMMLTNHEALELVVEIGGINKIMKSLTDPSMFVSKSAIKLLKKILQCVEETSSQQKASDLESQGKLLTSGGITLELFGLLAYAVKEKDVTASTAMLNTLSDICATEGITKCLFLNNQHVILLSRCLEDASLIKPASELILKAMEHTNILPCPLPSLLAESSERLVRLHKLDDALRTAAKVLVVFESRDKLIHQKQRSLLQHPIRLLTQDSVSSVDPLQEFFDGKAIFRRATLCLVCRCKDLMKNSPEVEPVLTLRDLHTVLETTLTVGIPISTKWSQFLHGSVQIQKAAFDYLKLIADQKTACPKEDLEKTVAILIAILESADTDTGVMVKSIDTLLAFIACMLVCLHPFPNIGRLMQKLMCDVRWEVRDSALTFVAGVCASNSEKVTDWILEHNFQQFVMDGIKDSDNYVRATALSSIQQMFSCRQLWKTADQLEQLVDAAMEIITNDAEGFPRRSAMSLLCYLVKAGSIPETVLPKTYSCVASARNDFDWEVKLHAIEFWEGVIANTLLEGGSHLRNGNDIPSYAQTLFQNSFTLTCAADNDCDGGSEGTKRQKDYLEKLERLQSNHCLESLLSSAGDYDQSVKLKACEVLLDLRTKCESRGISSDFIDTELKKVGLTKADDTIEFGNFLSFSSDSMLNSETFIEVKVDGDCKCEHFSRTFQFLSILFSLDLDTLMRQLQQTTDEYVSNPESLLDDIIAWSTESEDILVDCY
ncbi:BRCA1-associated ATM activator 1-like isoform X2 [Lineus longissimus]